MKKLGTILGAAFIIAIAVVGCKKYPEGPGLTLLSKKARLANDWKFEKFLNKGVEDADALKLYSSSSFKYEKDGTWTSSITTSFGTVTDKGEWKFNDDKTWLLTKDEGDTEFDTAGFIVKLKNKELWISDYEDRNKGGETHFVPN